MQNCKFQNIYEKLMCAAIEIWLYALQVTKYQAEALEMALEFETSDFTEDTQRQFKEVLVSIWYSPFSVANFLQSIYK